MPTPFSFCPQCGDTLGERLIEQKLQRACRSPSCDYVWWNNPTPVVAGLIQVGEHVVLARNKAWPEERYSMITGFLDTEEHPEEALIRETKEELGLALIEHRFLGHYSFKASNQILIAYWARAEGTVIPGEEIASTRLYTLQQFASYDFGPFYIAAAIAKQWIASWPVHPRPPK